MAPEAKVEPPKLLVLPSFIRSKQDVQQMVSEILQIEDFLNKASVRESGTKMSLPKTTADLDKFAEANKRNVLNHGHRMELARFLRDVYRKAPTLGAAFAVNENPKVINGVVDWFRANVHAQTMFEVTMTAKMGPGCMIRIKHKTYDFSLKKRFNEALPVLEEALSAKEPEADTTERRNFL